MTTEQSSLTEFVFPSCNIHSFVFSNPFTPSSPLAYKIASLRGIPSPTISPALPHKTIFFDPISAAAITRDGLKRDTLRIAHGIHKCFGPPRITDAFGSNSLSGPVVLIHLPNCITFPVLVLGFIAAGWTVTMTNPAYTATELGHVMALCEPRVVVCAPGAGGEDNVRAACTMVERSREQGLGGVVVPELLFVDPDDEAYGAQKRVESRRKSWTTLLSNEELDASLIASDGMDRRVALLLLTSGTTGKPKAAMVPHRAVVAALIMIWVGKYSHLPDERWISTVPFYHMFGLYIHVLLGPCIGATIIVVPKFDLESYLRTVSSHQVTHLHIAPPIAVAFAKSPLIDAPWCSLASASSATSGGAPLHAEVIQEVWKRTGVVIKSGYGLTEAGPVTTFGSSQWEEVEPHLGANGRIVFGAQASIVDVNMKPLKGTAEGEIIVRSPALMLGYLNNPSATAETLDEMGLHTGDLGYFNEAGLLRITGRIKELIKYKGFQVSPTELESVIATLPSVQDVAVSSVYSSTEGTELPMAYVVPQGVKEVQLVAAATAGASDAQANVNGEARCSVLISSPTWPSEVLVSLAEKVAKVVEKNCVHYKRLRGGVTVVGGIPRSPNGKILRSALKDQKGVHVQVYSKPSPAAILSRL